MKKDLHPIYENSAITCACGNVIKTRSTKPNIKVEICSNCHPLFTGKQKLVDTAGRVDKFKARQEAAQTAKNVQKPKKERKVPELIKIEDELASKIVELKQEIITPKEASQKENQ